MSRHDPNNREWYEASFAMLVSNDEVRRAARTEMDRLAAGTDLSPQMSDLEGARNYFRKCIFNMPVVEVEALSATDAGALWARGAFGAARFRRDGAKRKHRLRRSRRLGRGTSADDDSGERGEP